MWVRRSAPVGEFGEFGEFGDAGLLSAHYDRTMSSLYELQMTSITGEQVSFDRFRGQVLLIVNVASA